MKVQAGDVDQHQGIAGCSLTPLELVDRQAEWQDVAPAVIDRGPVEGGFRVRFRQDPGVAEALRALVAAEGGCCGWASWRLTDQGACIVLEVTGPADRIGSLATAFGL